MKDTYIAWMLGAAALVLSIACIVIDVAFAHSLAGIHTLAATRALVFIAFGVSIAAAGSFVFFVTNFVQKLNNRSISFNHTSAWRRFGVCAGISTFSALLSASTLAWLVVREHQLPIRTFHQSSNKLLLVVWFILWGFATATQIATFVFIGLWTARVLRAQDVGQLDLDFGIRLPSMDEVRPTTRDTSRSFQSQGPTLHSPPRTPTTPRMGSSIRHSSSTRIGPGSSRTKLVTKSSARSSSDFPVREAFSLDSAFDSWDTSSVHREIRAVLHSSPPIAWGILETIPGSRSVSPADALDGPFLPESPHATSSDTATALDWIPSSPTRLNSTPPSSPPNFSRPTSRSYNKPSLIGPSMTELIHPLFRPNSPRPPPIAVAGTMVTASPLAGQSITPRTLARMRSNTLPQYWRPLPSPVKSSNAGSQPSSPGPGSPGPSIAEDQDLPPILPGFVLSAGQRTSLVGYGRRKSTKERPKSAHSVGSRTSMVFA